MVFSTLLILACLTLYKAALANNSTAPLPEQCSRVCPGDKDNLIFRTPPGFQVRLAPVPNSGRLIKRDQYFSQMCSADAWDSYSYLQLHMFDPGFGWLGRDQACFCFNKPKNVNWWKGIKIPSYAEGKTELSGEGVPETKMTSQLWSVSELPLWNKPGGNTEWVAVEIWKAMAFGVHTYDHSVYFRQDCLRGKIVEITFLSN